ncbi:MAG: rhodanese-like domain-containing protein [Rhodospirillales bacterium]
MNSPTPRVDAKTLKTYLHDGGEIALLDAREEVPFDRRHILMASCVPLGRLETIVDALIPRRAARVVWCDDGEGLAEKAAARMTALGYTNVAVLDGGIAAWEKAGYRIYSGVHVPSKAFAEVVEHEAGTPHITAQELKALIDSKADIALFDSRSYEEYHVNSIPSAINVPGAELVYRFTDLVPSPDTTVVVNCGGRTRSIIGAQSLINARFPNKIVSLKNGTQDWHLAGFEVIKGATRTPPPVSGKGLKEAQAAAARVAKLCGVTVIDRKVLGAWHAEASKHALYVLDVRTPEEYEAGHLPGVKNAPGGQLIQETDRHLGIWGARVVLVDDNGVRATMTASWLKQMGWNASVITVDEAGGATEKGSYKPNALGLDGKAVSFIAPGDLDRKLKDGAAAVIDLDWSRKYYDGHIPGAWFMIRARLAEDLKKLPKADATDTIVLTSPDGILAQLAADDVKALTPASVMVLAGGTQAWKAAGLPLEKGATHMASAAEDLRLRAREMNRNVEEAMRAYLAWEIDLVNQMAADDDQRFQIVKG